VFYRKYKIRSNSFFDFHFYTANFQRKVGFVVTCKYFGVRVVTENYTYLLEV